MPSVTRLMQLQATRMTAPLQESQKAGLFCKISKTVFY